MLNEIFGGKDWFKSLTAWGLFIAAAGLKYGETTLPGAEVVASWMPMVGTIMTFLGLRRAATAPNKTVETVVKDAA